MRALVRPFRAAGTARVPFSKSELHRLLIAAALAEGLTWISCAQSNEDADATASCLTALGADILPYDEADARIFG